MKNDIKSIDDVLNKVDQIRESLRFSDEIFPLLSDLFTFLKETIPLMLEANVSIRESTSRLPDATNNLNKVSETTAEAATQVMDKLDEVLAQLDELSDSIKSDSEKETQLAKIEDIHNEASEIIFSLQFQDITSQQLEHTHRILQAVNEKFMHLIRSFGHIKATTLLGKDVVAAIEKECEREAAEENKKFFEDRTQDIIRINNGVSQDDIDNLFK